MRHFKAISRAISLSLMAMMAATAGAGNNSGVVEQWRIFELAMPGSKADNPFTDTQLSAQFVQGSDTVNVKGFYDGDGIYKVRFMPSTPGNWKYSTRSNDKKLNNRKGSLRCTPAKSGNHGMVKTDSLRFRYSDGEPYIPVGTTCYAWVHQPEELKAQTVETLGEGYFNKMRMCIFPKSYDWNHNEPEYYPFEGKTGSWDYTRFNPEYFRNIERGIEALDSLGIEADLIVFHPYDRWGFSSLDLDTRDRYMQYIISRFGAYKNVWWSMANEYDFMSAYKEDDWKHLLEFFAGNDPYGHLRGIHNGTRLYDHNDPNVTHVSIQAPDTRNGRNLAEKYRKPVVYDECRYEGNIPWSWGTLSGEEMVEKFWDGFLSGAYVGHGEVLLERSDVSPWESDEVLWWSKGGKLKGKSPERIRFLTKILNEAPKDMKPADGLTGWQKYPIMGSGNDFYLLYLGRDVQCQKILELPADKKYNIELIDTWDMTVTPLPGTYSGNSLIEMPAKPYMAVRVTSIK